MSKRVTIRPNTCPVCGSENIDYQTFEWFDDRVEYPASCLETGCEADFVEVYKYHHSEFEG